MTDHDHNTTEAPIVHVDPAELRPSVSSFAPFSQRQGLFIHSFQCMSCSLEFALFSWWPDRHTVMNTACPECHRITQKSHFMSAMSDNPKQRFGEGREIFHYSPVGPSPVSMADSSLFTGLPEEEKLGSANCIDVANLFGNHLRLGGEPQ